MPTKRVSATDLRQAVATAKNLPITPRGRSIKQNILQTLAKVKSVPANVGTGLCNQKGTN